MMGVLCNHNLYKLLFEEERKPCPPAHSLHLVLGAPKAPHPLPLVQNPPEKLEHLVDQDDRKREGQNQKPLVPAGKARRARV